MIESDSAIIQLATTGTESSRLLDACDELLKTDYRATVIGEGHYKVEPGLNIHHANILIYQMLELSELCSEDTKYVHIFIKGINSYQKVSNIRSNSAIL